MPIACAIALMGETSFAIIQKSWDSIFNAEGQGDYAAAKIEGNMKNLLPPKEAPVKSRIDSANSRMEDFRDITRLLHTN